MTTGDEQRREDHGMTMDEIRRAVRKEPFEPFTIHRADGQSHRVVHPEFVIAPERARIVVVYQPGEGYDMVDVRLITALEFGGSDPPSSRKRAG
jgi:hypothetical protein